MKQTQKYSATKTNGQEITITRNIGEDDLQPQITISRTLAASILKELEKQLEIAEPEAFSPEAIEDVNQLWLMRDEIKKALES